MDTTLLENTGDEPCFSLDSKLPRVEICLISQDKAIPKASFLHFKFKSLWKSK